MYLNGAGRGCLPPDHPCFFQHTRKDALSGADLVFVIYRSLPVGTQIHVRRWVGEMISGMRKFVLLYPHGIRIQNLEEYKEYCYYVAGTVGYLLTDLWHEHAPSIGDTTRPTSHVRRNKTTN